MSFTLPKGAREFFRQIDHQAAAKGLFGLLFDRYYLCVLLGLDLRKLGSADSLEAEEFVRDYPAAYHSQADVIAGLLIDAELDRKGIEAEDRVSVQDVALQLLDHASSTKLSADGMALLNRYAVAGFETISELPRPATLEAFLIAYDRLWTARDGAQTTAP